MKLTNIAEVTEAITGLLSEPRKDKPSKLMLSALEAVIEQVESKARGSEDTLKAMTKVREAYGIPKTNDSTEANNGETNTLRQRQDQDRPTVEARATKARLRHGSNPTGDLPTK
ncbi:MAG: hypothetical protein ACK5SP_02230 [bacterium]|jgi:hypothetical protein